MSDTSPGPGPGPGPQGPHGASAPSAPSAPSDDAAARGLALLDGTPYGRLVTSRHALPCVAVAHHVVVGRSVLLRLHRGSGHHTAGDGGVVAYQADNLAAGESEVWSVQLVGRARADAPDPAEVRRFGPPAATADGTPYVPAYLRLAPRFVTVQRLSGVPRVPRPR